MSSSASGLTAISTAVPGANPWAPTTQQPPASRSRMAPSAVTDATVPASRLVVPMKSATKRVRGRS